MSEKQLFECQRCGYQEKIETVFQYEVCPKCDRNFLPVTPKDEKMSEELKPCPFCRSTDVHVENKDLFYWGECYACGATSRDFRLRDKFINGEQGVEGASNYWNSRPVEDALAAERASLKSQRDEAVRAIEQLLPEWQGVDLDSFSHDRYARARKLIARIRQEEKEVKNV